MSQNTVPTVKLQDLLQKLPQWQQAYATKSAQYNLGNNTQLVTDFNRILGNGGIIPNIQNEYNIQMRNAQANP